MNPGCTFRGGLKLKAGLFAVARAQGPGAVNAGDLEAYWRELLGVHSPARSRPAGQSLATLLGEIGREEHAVTCRDGPTVPPRVKRTNPIRPFFLAPVPCFPALKVE